VFNLKDMMMRTMTIEYDDSNRAVTQVLKGLIAAGLIRRSKPVPRRRRQVIEFENALREAKAMAADIAVNGTAGYLTMDEFLKTLEDEKNPLDPQVPEVVQTFA
jgi:DNA-binding MarR family transcriptional regulator